MLDHTLSDRLLPADKKWKGISDGRDVPFYSTNVPSDTPPHPLVFPLGSRGTSTHSVFTAAGEPVCSIYAHNWGEERWGWQWGATVRGSPYQNAVRIQKVQPFEPVRGQISVSLGGWIVNKFGEDTGLDKAAMPEQKSTSLTTWGPWLNMIDFLRMRSLIFFLWYHT